MARASDLWGKPARWVVALEPHRARGLVMHLHGLVWVPSAMEDDVQESVKVRAMWEQAFATCGRTLIEPYEARAGAMYAAKYVSKGGAVYFSSNLQPTGALFDQGRLGGKGEESGATATVRSRAQLPSSSQTLATVGARADWEGGGAHRAAPIARLRSLVAS